VLLIHAWWGLNAFFKQTCDRLAAEGLVVMAPDLFDGEVALTPEEAKHLRDKPRREPTYKTLLAAIDQLRSHPAAEGPTIGIVGFSMGAHWAFWLAAQRPVLPIGAVVAFYGARAGVFGASQAAFQAHLAEHDEWVSDSSLKKLKKALKAASRPAEFFVYPNTGHWFFESDRADAYQPQAADLAWARTVDFLRTHLA
jgi:carboxymethylenebutenolidase